MPGFQFELSQLVNVPGKDGLQGRVSSRMEDVNKPSIYQVTWLTADCASLNFEMFSEAEMIEAQKKKPDSAMTVKIEADTSDLDKLDARIKTTTAAAAGLSDTLSKLPQNAFRARKSKRRAKR